MEREKKSKHFIQQPEFPGGPKALSQFVYQNLRYPAEALEAKIEGTVLVEYDIDFKGNVVETRVLQGLGHGLDEEACRVIRLLKFSVGRNRGVRVLFHKKMPVRFKIPAQATKPAPAPGQVVYNYVYTTTPPTTAEPNPNQAEPGVRYSYSISLDNKD